MFKNIFLYELKCIWVFFLFFKFLLRIVCFFFRFVEDFGSFFLLYYNLINNFVKLEKLIKVEMKFKEKVVVEMMKLNK